jgi:predicted metal-dependent hydrolase
MMESGVLRFGRRDIAFQIQRSSRRQTLGISVNSSGVTLIAPARLEFAAINQLAQRKARWVFQKVRHFETLHLAPVHPKTFESGESFRYLGRLYRLKRQPFEGTPSLKLRGAFFEMRAADLSQARALMEAWYRARALDRIAERVARYSLRLGYPVPTVLIRDQRQRWGSCSAAGELRFNWRIIMAPMRLVDYVVAHELCHLQVKNHSRSFWRLLTQLLPDYESRREALAVQGSTYKI